MTYRTDADNNPTAFTVSIAEEADLVLGTDYEPGSPFPYGPLVTARLLGDPVTLTIRVLDKLGFYTESGSQRWGYISLPNFIWLSLTSDIKRDVIGFMYQREGGIEMRHLFPNYGEK